MIDFIKLHVREKDERFNFFFINQKLKIKKRVIIEMTNKFQMKKNIEK